MPIRATHFLILTGWFTFTDFALSILTALSIGAVAVEITFGLRTITLDVFTTGRSSRISATADIIANLFDFSITTGRTPCFVSFIGAIDCAVASQVFTDTSAIAAAQLSVRAGGAIAVTGRNVARLVLYGVFDSATELLAKFTLPKAV